MKSIFEVQLDGKKYSLGVNSMDNLAVLVHRDGMISIRLSGSHLALVLEMIGGIPRPQVKMNHFTWFGDDARTVLNFLYHHDLHHRDKP